MTRSLPLRALLLSFAAPTAALPQAPDARALAEKVVSISSVVGGEGPMWAPDGTRILFASTLGGGGIWSVAWDGGMPARVTREISTQLVRLSPDGRRLAY